MSLALLKPKIQPEVVEILNDLLAMAQTGEIQDIAVVAVLNDASTQTRHSAARLVSVLGGCVILQTELLGLLTEEE